MQSPADGYSRPTANSLKMVMLLVATAFPVGELKLSILLKKGATAVSHKYLQMGVLSLDL